MTEIVRGATQTPVSSDRLTSFFRKENLDGVFYIGYPIFATPEGKFPIDGIYASPTYGVILFHIVENTIDGIDYQERQDDLYNKLEAKLRNHKELMTGRSLGVPISVLTYAPNINDNKIVELQTDDYPLCNDGNLMEVIQKNKQPNEFIKYKETLSVLQSVSTIRKGIKHRRLEHENSKGAKLQELENSIANLDNHQGKAVIETVDKVQRIRGLAGSGKTIVLALKAAYLHAQHPEWNIAVTFNTRSLKGQFKKLIHTFTIEQTGEEPNWDRLRIIQAWGSAAEAQKGVYYSFCIENGVEYLDFGQAKNRFGQADAFSKACEIALSKVKNPTKLFDVILVDEAQDFPMSFLQLCYHSLNSVKRLVYAYDELQSLSSMSLPSPEELFGNDVHGKPLVTLDDSSQDIILEKCYRNSKSVLTTAHALGFGVYRNKDSRTGTGLIQMFDDANLWKEVGYEVSTGVLEEGKDVSLTRTNKSSPSFLETKLTNNPSELLEFLCFSNYDEQVDWVVEEIQKNLQKEELRTDDIIVINPDPFSTKQNVAPIRAKLYEHGINSHLAGVDTTPDIFFKQEDSIAFTGIYRAKGNEAGMVYIINAQDCFSEFGNLATVRNRLFTAMTRSKAWVKVLGVGDDMQHLISEFEKVKSHSYQLDFTYPTQEQREKLKVINRDKSNKEKHDTRTAEDALAKLVNGEVFIEDLSPELVQLLKEKLER